MIRRYEPDPHALAVALAGRVDTLETQLRQTATDVTALGRGVADLTAQIRRLTSVDTTPDENGRPSTDSGDADGDGDAPEGQPDWYAVTDPDTARAILAGLRDWVDQVGRHHGVTLPVACWPLHPDVVADLLAVATERESAYTGPAPTPVSEWLTRWAPATAARITTALAECVADHAHHHTADHSSRLHDVTGLDSDSAAAWWALDRDTPAPQALDLPRL